jgi:hypothetical protein
VGIEVEMEMTMVMMIKRNRLKEGKERERGRHILKSALLTSHLSEMSHTIYDALLYAHCDGTPQS